MLKDLTDSLSDFNSCVSVSESSEEADNEAENNPKPWITMNERQKTKRNKRRNSMTPNKEVFLKKLNLAD